MIFCLFHMIARCKVKQLVLGRGHCNTPLDTKSPETSLRCILWGLPYFIESDALILAHSWLTKRCQQRPSQLCPHFLLLTRVVRSHSLVSAEEGPLLQAREGQGVGLCILRVLSHLNAFFSWSPLQHAHQIWQGCDCNWYWTAVSQFHTLDLIFSYNQPHGCKRLLIFSTDIKSQWFGTCLEPKF